MGLKQHGPDSSDNTMRLHNDDNEVVWCISKWIWSSGHDIIDYFHTVIKETTAVPEYIWNQYHMMAQPRKNMNHIGKLDTSDLMQIIRWVTNISSRSPKLEYDSLTYTNPHIAKKIMEVNEKTNYILDPISIEYTKQAFARTYRIFHRICLINDNYIIMPIRLKHCHI